MIFFSLLLNRGPAKTITSSPTGSLVCSESGRATVAYIHTSTDSELVRSWLSHALSVAAAVASISVLYQVCER